MIYKTFEEWKAGQWLEDGELRTEAYTEDELLLVEMGWKYGFDAGKKQIKQGEPVAYVDNRCNDSIEWLVGPLKLDEGTRLYTAPRELSDEEIEECIVAWVKEIYGNEYVTPSDSHITQGTRLIKLAEEMRLNK